MRAKRGRPIVTALAFALLFAPAIFSSRSFEGSGSVAEKPDKGVVGATFLS